MELWKKAYLLTRSVAADLFWEGPADQVQQQEQLEEELFTFCDGISPEEVGMHWSFDWLFGHKEIFALAVGRVFRQNRRYTQASFKHQTNTSGVIYDVIFPLEAFRFDAEKGELQIKYEGEAEVQVHRLHTAESPSQRLWIHLQMTKETSRKKPAPRLWSNKGKLQIREKKGGSPLSRWEWGYTFDRIADRPDYNIQSLLDLLNADAVPGGNGHFIPALSAEVKGSVLYEDEAQSATAHTLQGGYLDGNFGRTTTDKASRLVHDHWGWAVLPRLWTTDGVPVEHMFMTGFFKAPLVPGLSPPWSGIILWRRDPSHISRFKLKTMRAQIEVRHHSRAYLDLTAIPPERDYRITIRGWSDAMTSPLIPPGSKMFRDHQDLLADAYVIVEQNTVPPLLRRFKKPRWQLVDRLVTNMAGCEFGERDRVVGSPGYPTYSAVPEKPPWFCQALDRIPDAPFEAQTTAYRLREIESSSSPGLLRTALQQLLGQGGK